MEFVLVENHRNTPDKELLSDVISVSKLLSKESLTLEEYNKYGKYHSTTLTRRFGSWFDILEKCGLAPSRPMINIPKEELFDNLEKLWRHFGRQPKYHEVKKPLSKYSVGTYEKRWGTYYNALKAFVEDINGVIVNEKFRTEDKDTKNPRAINYRTRFIVMRRDGFQCKICGASPAKDPNVTLHIDHIIPCAKGGIADIENLQTLCSKCNYGKSDLDMYNDNNYTITNEKN